LYDAKATDVAQDADGVTLTIERPDGSTEPLRAAFLVGADGARSAVRRALGIAFEGMTIPETYLTLSTTFRFERVIPDLANIAYISDPEEWFVLLQAAGLWRVLLPTAPEEAADESRMLDPARIEERMQGVLPNPAGYEIRHRTAYRVHERVAETYAKGRVFLAGDAAHINNPLGGMGMNGGVHDAFNLAEKLSQVWKGDADQALMERYSRQRRKVAVDVVQQQALRNRQLLNQREPSVRRAYHDELRGIAADPAKHHAHLLRSSMIQSLRDLEAVA
jgi:3-(3-hydroxy-phenyl)propionate hydroxylase